MPLSAASETGESWLGGLSLNLLRSSSIVILWSFRYDSSSPDAPRFNENAIGKTSDDEATEPVTGKSSLIGAEPTIAGTVIMNTMSSTSTTSTNGVTLISLI